jgi:putative hemolysin
MIKYLSMNNKKIITVISLIVIVLGVIYLSNFKKNTPENSVTNEPLTNMANPASTFCIESKGTLEEYTTPEGVSNYCVLPSGQKCDEWAFYRGECNLNQDTSRMMNPALMNQVKDTTTDTMPVKDIGMANPASTFCIESGGTLEIVETPEGQIGNCTLPNGTVCEEWALFRGECK